MSDKRLEAKKEQNRLFPNAAHPLQPGPTLLEICLDVRASTDGSADPWSREALIQTRKMLADTVASWDDGRDDAIDACVWFMCKLTVKGIDAELKSRKDSGSDF